MEDKQKLEMDILERKGCLLYAYKMLKISSNPEHQAHKDLVSLIEAMELSLETPDVPVVELTSAQVACMVALGEVTGSLDLLGSLTMKAQVIKKAIERAEGQDELSAPLIVELATRMISTAPESAKDGKQYQGLVSLREKAFAAVAEGEEGVSVDMNEHCCYQALKAMHYAGIFKS